MYSLPWAIVLTFFHSLFSDVNSKLQDDVLIYGFSMGARQPLEAHWEETAEGWNQLQMEASRVL